MGKHIARQGQSIYDIALYIHGSIEGITDLLMNNSNLSLSTIIKPGDVIAYTDNYVINQSIRTFNLSSANQPANGERSVYFRSPNIKLIAEFRCKNSNTSASFVASGSGTLLVDWGDNANLQSIVLSDTPVSITHYFTNQSADQRIIRLCGEVLFKTLDLSNVLASEIYFTEPISIEKFTLSKSSAPLDFLSLASNTFQIKLDNLTTGNLLPLIDCKRAMSINLSGLITTQPVVDEYLKQLVKKYSDRRSCEVKLNIVPSGTYSEPARDANLNYIISSGMEAIWVITNEPAWNEAGYWVFTINNNIYTAEQ